MSKSNKVTVSQKQAITTFTASAAGAMSIHIDGV